MAKLNITHAAKAVGKSRRTLQNHIKEGKLSVEVDGQGNKLVDTSELLRVYGQLDDKPVANAQRNSQRKTANDSQHSTPDFTSIIKTLESQVEGLRQDKTELMQQLRDTHEQHQRREEKLLGIVEKQTLMLEKPREEPKTQEPQPQQRDWFKIGLVALNAALLIAITLKVFVF